MLLLLTQPKLPLPYRTYYRTYHIYRLIIIILRMTKFPPKYFNMKNVNLTLHISSRRGKTVCRQSPSVSSRRGKTVCRQSPSERVHYNIFQLSLSFISTD